MIDSDATAHCTDDQSIFENLTLWIDKLTTADEFLKIVKKIDLELFHWWLRHVKKKTLKYILKTVRNIEIQNEKFSDDCKICTHAQKMKVQSHETVKSASKPVKKLHIDFWDSYWHDNMNDSWYILMMIDDYTWHEWIFTIKNQSFETFIEILKSLIKQIEHESDWKIKWMRMNNAKKFLKLTKWAEKKRIVAELIFSYTSE